MGPRMTKLTVHLSNHGASDLIAPAIQSALEAEGVDIAANPGDAGAYIQITLSEAVAPLIPYSGRRLIVVAGLPPDPVQHSWRLIRSGVDDVLFWIGPETAPEISARIVRWSTMAELVQGAASEADAIGTSPAWQTALGQICEATCFGSAPLLILGQTGTGKEVAAKVAIAAADCASDCISIVDCGAVSRDLIGSELFGHERGAFTGAHSERVGAVAVADGGILFLDEIGELPLDIQPYFLRLLQDGTYRRLGGTKLKSSRFRLIAATNRDLAAMVDAGRFREDLYHRIAATTINLPCLADRPDDILPLATHFLTQAGGPLTLDPAVSDHLMTREYPGNIRELRQICQRLATNAVGGSVRIGDLVRALPDCIEHTSMPPRTITSAVAAAVDGGASLAQIKSLAAEAAILHALSLSDGSTNLAAKRLDVTPRALQLRARSSS